MRTVIISLAIFLSLTAHKSFACDCESQGNFYKVSEQSSLVALVKISQYLTFKDIYGSPTPMSMEAEIIEIFKGSEKRKKIRIWGDNGRQCRPYLSQFSVDSTYVIAFYPELRGGVDREVETETDYSISSCGEYWLESSSTPETYVGRESTLEISRLRGLYERTDDLAPADFEKIFQKALDFPEFQQYYHTDFDSTRKQVIIKYFGDANHNNLVGVSKFGRQVLIKTEEEMSKEGIKNYFGIGDWLCGTNSVRMQLYYHPEGITLSLAFKKVNGEWTIANSALWEE